MVEPIVKSEQQGELFLPPGFRFHPTDEEIITCYLLQKFLNPSFAPRAVGEVDLNRCEPWDLPSKAKMGEKEWYFFCHKDMKYPTGTRTNRATEVGYWKATGKDREIFKPASASGGGRELIGMKKTLVFYMGRAPRGSKTNWVMHEYRLHGKSRDENANLRFNRKDEWVVSKVFHKKGETNKAAMGVEYSAGTPNVSSVEAAAEDDEFIDSMMDPMYFNSTSAAVPNMMMTSNATAAAYNTDYSNPSTAEATTNPSSFADLPSYSFMNNATNRNVRNYSGSSSWNMFHSDDPMESYSLQQQQAIMIKALGGAIPQNYAGVDLPTSAAAVTGVLQPNSLGALQQKPGAATATIGQDAKILRDRLARY